MTQQPRRTWDGHPVSATPPYGAMIVVFRRSQAGTEYLLLHRAHHGPDYEGPWAWGPPSGARHPGEDIDRCAARELLEETGIKTEPRAVDGLDGDWPVYLLEVDSDVSLRLSAEHDRYRWFLFEEAAAHIQPQIVRDAFCATVEM